VADGPRQELAEGESFAGYRIERRLGRGGMGIVYLAIEEALERKVALKLISPDAASDEVFRTRFAHESRIAASIEHPNVVPIYSAGEEEGIPYIAMRFVSGSDLGRRVAGGNRLEPAHAAALIAQVGNGLDAIHAAGLVHRDVKPANVLLSGREGAEHAYITDFGVARNVAETSGLTKTGRFIGTLDYVAPEQISGAKVDARSDVYALGCLLFKLLSGDVPFPKDDEAGRLYAHLHESPPSPSVFAPEVPKELDEVVIRALSKDADDRYPSAGDLGRAALAAVGAGTVTLPERTVATGAAALDETAALPGAPTAEEAKASSLAGAATAGAPSREDLPPTRHLPPDEHPPQRPEEEHRDRRFALFGAGAVIIALIIGAVVASGGGGGGGDGDGSSSPQQTVDGNTGSTAPSKPQPLSRQQLIAGGDAICRQSQDDFRNTLAAFPDGETTPDVEYSKMLVGISGRAVPKFQALVPPAAVRKPYEDYVAAQERVHQYDIDALAAAKAGSTDDYLAARANRDNEQFLRFQLARQVGFQTCSLSPE
jgi:predicted Ser/Thr protein kinase